MLYVNHPACKIGVVSVALIVAARSASFLVWPQLSFDADQAVTGLMAVHLADGRALPVFQYAQQYVLVLESWLLTPLIVLGGGPSPSLVKSVPALLNVVTGALLYYTLCRRAQLGPFPAAVAVMPFAVPGPTTSSHLTDALGMTIEPLLFTVVLWWLRARPIALGVTAALAVLNREFVVYALAALACVELLQGGGRAPRWRAHALTAVAFVLTWSAVDLLKQYSTPLGPGTRVEAPGAPAGPGNLAVAASFVCFDVPAAAADIRTVASHLLPVQLGLGDERWVRYRRAGPLTPIRHGLWVALAAVLVVGCGRGLVRAWRHGPTPATWFGLYLLLAGVQAVAVYATLAGTSAWATFAIRCSASSRRSARSRWRSTASRDAVSPRA
jgi:hypothetical protein